MYRKERARWTKHSEKALLLLWSKNISRLRGNRKNRHIVAEMLEELKAQGFEFTFSELKTKIQNLIARYRKEKRGLKKTEVTIDGWDIVKEMDIVFKSKQTNDMDSFVVDSINNINSSITTDPLSPVLNNSSLFPPMLESSASASPLKPPDSPLSSRYSDSSSSDTSFSAAKKKKKEFDQFFENLEQSMEKINEDIKTTIEKIISIEEEKRDILKVLVEKEGEVQEALLDFLKRN